MSSPSFLWPDLVAAKLFHVDPALQVLRRYGAPVEDSAFTAAVGVALMHTSFFHENQPQLPGVTRGVLDALVRLGSALGAFLSE
jgi:hypothetical protein